MWFQPTVLHTKCTLQNAFSRGVMNQNSLVKEARMQKTFQEKKRRD